MLRLLRVLGYATSCVLTVAVAGSPAMAGDGTGGVTCTNPQNPHCDLEAKTPGRNGPPGGGHSGEPAGVSPGGTGLEARMLIVGVPQELARLARARLNLPDVVISFNPPGNQLTWLPTWLTLDRASWRPQSATASVPGVSVTAIARPVRATWRMGDRFVDQPEGVVVCQGPGTAWKPDTDPLASSPDCGYTYRRSSASTAGGRFTVTVTVAWEVTWAGAGESGTIPGLTTMRTVQVLVQESQAVIS